MSKPVGRPITSQCPSEAAYKRHQRNKDDVCEDPDGCKAEWAAAQRRYYAKRKGIK